MDARKKFVIQIIILLTTVVILGIFVYISSTDDPFEQEQEGSPFDPVPISELPQRNRFNPLGSAGGDAENVNETVVGTVTLKKPEIPTLTIEIEDGALKLQEDEVRYTVVMNISWSELLHPKWYPPNAHLSPAVAWSHRMKDVLFKEGERASDGIKMMAETGATGTLEEEIREMGEKGFLFYYDIGTLTQAPGEDLVQLIMSEQAQYASVVSMIAPSPDWFVAAHNVNLFSNGNWIKRKSVPAIIYDAGTDNGETFNAWDNETQPREPITRHAGMPAVPIVTFEFIKSE